MFMFGFEMNACDSRDVALFPSNGYLHCCLHRKLQAMRKLDLEFVQTETNLNWIDSSEMLWLINHPYRSHGSFATGYFRIG